jgi:thiamine-phosphate pyrophosphorylase
VGADFVLVGDLIWTDPRGAAAALADARAAIGTACGKIKVEQG